MYVYKEFPKCKYSADGSVVTVHDAAAEAALGDGWYNTPNDIPAPAADPERPKRGRRKAEAAE